MQPLLIHVPFYKYDLNDTSYELEEVELLLVGTISHDVYPPLTLARLLQDLTNDFEVDIKELFSAHNLEFLIHAELQSRIHRFLTACAHKGIGLIPAYKALKNHACEWVPFVEIRFEFLKEA